MNYILDTNILIEIENNNQEVINKINDLKKTPFAELCITIFSFCELFYALEKKGKPIQQFDVFIAAIEHESVLITGDNDFSYIPGLKSILFAV